MGDHDYIHAAKELERSRHPDARLTEKEKAFRDWLVQQPNGLEYWMLVKGGYRKSFRLGYEAALNNIGREEANRGSRRSAVHVIREGDVVFQEVTE